MKIDNKTKRKIYRQYMSLKRQRQKIKTVDDMAGKYGISRSRLYKIIDDIENEKK